MEDRREGSSAGASTSGAAAAPSFPLASQPDLVRATQKDELYLAHVTEACNDVVQRVLGVRVAIQFQREVRLLASGLYYGLTTGMGSQTLGEEYTDILQVGPGGGEPERWRGLTLAALQALAPYLARRMERAAQSPPLPPPPRVAAGEGAEGGGSGSWWELWRHARQEWLPEAYPAAAEAVVWAAQVHLALFYLYGVYFQPSKRALRVKHLFIAPPVFSRPSYHVLGVLLCCKLGVQAVLALWGRLATALPPSAPSQDLVSALGGERAAAVAGAVSRGWRGAVVVDDEGVAADMDPGGAGGPRAGGGGASNTSKCPLCLSPRAVPSSTKCGHVFCWKCIAEWCNEKPECPLCRAPISTSSIIPLVHSDL